MILINKLIFQHYLTGIIINRTQFQNLRIINLIFM